MSQALATVGGMKRPMKHCQRTARVRLDDMRDASADVGQLHTAAACGPKPAHQSPIAGEQ